MGGASTFLQLLSMIGFLSAAWSVSKASRLVGLPALVLEIGIGILLGPGVARLVGPEYTVCESRRFEECRLPSDIGRLVASELPIGPTLGRIANMDYCPYARYAEAARAANLSNMSNMSNMSNLSNMSNMSRLGGCGNWTNWTNMTNMTNWTNGSNASYAGCVLWSPPVLPYRSYEECLYQSCVKDLEMRCENNPGLFTLIGHAGVGLVLFETGMHFSWKQLTAPGVSLQALAVALIGAVVPFLTGMGLTALYGRPLVPDGVLVGTALVPTGSSYAMKMLQQSGALQSSFGQIISTAAMMDNLLSLLLFDIFFSLGGDFDGFRMVGSPIIGSFLVLVTLGLAAKFWPRFLQDILLPRVPEISTFGKTTVSADEVLYLLMFGWLVLFAWIMYLLGIFLWGCFMAGMSFACLDQVDRIRDMWQEHTKPLTNWLLRIFYACAVAFTIHPEVMFSGEAFWKGTVMGIFMGMAFKVIAGLALQDNRFKVGWAMAGRGELAFFFAQSATQVQMMSQMSYVVVIWALLWATVVSPFVFRLILRRSQASSLEVEVTVDMQGPPQARKVADAGPTAAERLGSLEGIDLEGCLGATKEISMASKSAELTDPAEAAGHSKASLLCCLFFREPTVH